jgi:ABC-type transport system involved in multi-copper enzyme maturation permease subunit
MSSVPQSTTEQPLPHPARNSNVVLGRQDFISVLLRSIGGELYKIQQRPMSKVLLTVAITVTILGFSIISLPALLSASSPIESYLPPPCDKSTNSLQTHCLDHPATQTDLAQAGQLKQVELKAAAEPIYLPGSIITAISISDFIGVMLLIILAGTVAGGEYNIGSIRIMLTRGPTRMQFLLAKLGAILICSAITLLTLLVIGIITGALLNLATSVEVSFKFFTGTWLLHCILLLLAGILELFIYSMVAMCLAVLGKATSAGVSGALIWWFMERVLSSALPYFGLSNPGPFGEFLKAVPDYFIANNISTLLNNQTQYMEGGQGGPISDLHAILVLAVYIIAFLGITAWVHQTRDITN